MTARDQPRVRFRPPDREVAGDPDATLLELAARGGVALENRCGGAGRCGRCRVVVRPGPVSAPTATEREWLPAAELARGARLACQARLAAGARGVVEVDCPAGSLAPAQRFQLEGRAREVVPDPARPPGEYGLAVDCGTSKLALFLVDLSRGETVESRGLPNPQLPHGADVISRIQYADAAPQQAAHLQRLVCDALGEALAELAAARRVGAEQIVALTLVGNPAMHHLVAGLPVRQLGRSPFRPATDQPLELTAAELGLGDRMAGRCHLPPVIAGFVGSDHLAALLATRLHREHAPGLLIDVGTNTEVTLCAGERLLSCSCASGPAFEGYGLAQGMRAAAGAIEAVRLDARGRLRISTVDGAEPRGLCGSGVVDALAALRALGVLDDGGRLGPGEPVTVGADGQPRVELAPGGAAGAAVELTQRDVRVIQQAKAAVRFGIAALLERARLGAADLEQVLLAGAFGSYLDPASAMAINLLPTVPLERIVPVGNAAGVGARELLCSAARRREARALAGRIEHVELASVPQAELRFAAATMFSEEAMEAYLARCGVRRRG